MKVAVPSNGDVVDDHFGHCKYFTVFELDSDNRVVAREKVDSPEGCGCKSNIASQLSAMGVQVMLAGNMGQGAVKVLDRNGIRVLRGCQGKIEDVVQAFAEGRLMDSGEGCDHHSCITGH